MADPVPALDMRPLTPEVRPLLPRNREGDLRKWLASPGHAELLCQDGFAWIVFDNLDFVMAGGLVPQWPGRSLAWAVIGDGVRRRHWPALTRKTVEVLDAAHAAGQRRIETTVRADHRAGQRWAWRLGFEPETPWPMRCYGPDGEAHLLYARIR